MKKVDDFRKAAADCRRMAGTAHDGTVRKMLMQMAEKWDALAVEREMDVARQERIRALNTKR